jgi:hypothetical protein
MKFQSCGIDGRACVESRITATLLIGAILGPSSTGQGDEPGTSIGWDEDNSNYCILQRYHELHRKFGLFTCPALGKCRESSIEPMIAIPREWLRFKLRQERTNK